MSKKKQLVVGIAGGSGSGKSTICSYFENALDDLNVKSIHMDDYYKTNKPDVISPFTGVVYADFNHPDSFDFDRLLNQYSIIAEQDVDVIIIEGLMTLYEERIREILDLKIYIDCQADERIIRRISRNSSWGESFEEITSVYLDAVRYRHNEFVEPSRWYADFILNGSNTSQIGKDIIIKWIRDQINN
ncbi:uridine kinase family protein [Vallitalea maricola]|uniref:Uridine kinase n=1 Tax=Vallitalea maricola TaxID=3074433 RepID=A0ACB5UNV2_9FIRM|nr:uridine kinase [Vallitalea sp. AN17-2]